jgi:transposase
MVAAENDFANELSELPIRLYYQDEARFGRINTVQKCWCMRGIIPSVKQQLIREYSYLFTAACPESGITCSLVMPTADTHAMDIFLKTLSEQQSNERIILCMDKAGWHTTKQLKVPQNIIIWFLPPYSPQLNPVELIWRELRTKYFNNKTFETLDDVDNYLAYSIIDYTQNLETIKQLTQFSISYN